jgi:hypothetical protein
MRVDTEKLLKAIAEPWGVGGAFVWSDTKEGGSYWDCYFFSKKDDPAFDGHRARLCEMYFEATGEKPRLRVKSGVRKVEMV